MPPRRATDHDDDELVQYVLGLLPDDARDRLDEASIADDDIAGRLRTVETNLIDSYVRGRLAGATLERFESHYLSSPLRRKNVRQAASFLGAVDRAAARTESAAWTYRIARATRFAPIAAVAALVMLVCGVFLFQAVRPRNELTLATSANRAVEPAAGPQRQSTTGRGVSVLAPPASATPGGQRAQSSERIVTMVLLPPTRSVAPIPTLVVPAGTGRVRFELQLESNDFPSYRVGLKNPATNQIPWRSDWIAPSSAGDQATVSVVVPAHLFRPQHYALDLAGRGADDREDVIGSYTVRIVQP